MNDVSAASTATVVPATVGLLASIDIRGVKLRSRIVLSPMCQYSSFEGLADDWHLVHLGSRAVGGAALVFTEATSVAREGRITPGDLGLARRPKWSRCDGSCRSSSSAARCWHPTCTRAQGVKQPPWRGSLPLASNEKRGRLIGAKPASIRRKAQTPIELSSADIDGIVAAFEAAAQRAVAMALR